MGDTINHTSKGTIRGGYYTLSLGSVGGDVGLVRQFQLQFGTPIQRVYDLFSSDFYFIKGPAQGQLTIDRIVGPKGAAVVDQLKTCPTAGQRATLDAAKTCGTNSRLGKYVMSDLILATISATGDSGTFTVGEGLQYQFGDLTT